MNCILGLKECNKDTTAVNLKRLVTETKILDN